MPAYSVSQQLADFLSKQRGKDKASFAGSKINPLPQTPTFDLGATSPVGGRPGNLLEPTLQAIQQTHADIGNPGGGGNNFPAMDPNVANKVMQLQGVRTNLNDPGKPHTGILGHVFDILGKGVNTVAGATEGAIDAAKHNGNPFSAIVHGVGGAFQGGAEGLTGSGKYAHQDWGDVLRHEGVHNGLLSTIAGIGGDVVLDPLNLIGVGEIAKVADIAKGGEHLLQGVKGLSDEQKAAALGHHVIDSVVERSKIPNERLRVDPAEIAAARGAAEPLWAQASKEISPLESVQRARQLEMAKQFDQNMQSLKEGVKQYRGLTLPGGNSIPLYKLHPDAMQRIKMLANKPSESVPALGEKIVPKTRESLADNAIKGIDAFKEAKRTNPLTGLSRVFTRPSQAVGGGLIGQHLLHAWGTMHDRVADIGNAIRSKFQDISPEHDAAMLHDYVRQPTPDFLKTSPYKSADGTHDYGATLAHYVPDLHTTLINPVFNPKATDGYKIINKYLKLQGLKDLSYTDFKDAGHFEKAIKDSFAALPPKTGATEALSRLHTALEKSVVEMNHMREYTKYGSKIHYKAIKTAGKNGRNLTKFKADESPLFKQRISEGWRAVDHPAFHGPHGPTHIFPPEIADRLEGLSHFMANPPARELPKDYDARKVIRATDRFLNHYKTALTVVNPGSHSRYLTGSVIQSWINGMRNPYNFVRGAKVALSRDPELRHLDPSQVLDPQFRAALQGGASRGGQDIMKSKRLGETLKSRDIYDEAAKRGVLHNFVRENLQGTNRLYRTLDKIGDRRDNIPRLGFFLDAIERAPKKLGNDRGRILDWAAHQTIQAHHNFGDMSGVEKKFLQRLIPFYADIRKNTPMVLRLMHQNPGRVAAYPLTLQEISEGTGGQKDWSNDPFYRDIVPQYLFDRGAVPVGKNGGNPIFLNQKNHVADVLYQLAGAHNLGAEPSYIGRQLLSSINPLLRVPIELAAKKSMYSGNPINSPKDYAMQQLPAADMIRQMIENTKANQANTGQSNVRTALDAAANNLLGVGLTEDTPRQQLSAVLSRLKPEQQKLRKQQPGFKAP